MASNRLFPFLLFVFVVFFSNSLFSQIKDNLNHPDSLYDHARNLMEENRFEEAIAQYSKLANTTTWMKDLSNARKTYNNLGFSYYKLQKYDSSGYYYVKSNHMAILLQDTTRTIISYNSIAMAYRNLGLYAKSLENSHLALDLAELIGDEGSMADIYNTMALMYSNLGEYDKAITHTKKSLAKSTSLGDSVGMAYSLNNIGISYQKLGQFDSSLNYNFNALRLKHLLSTDPHSYVANLTNIGIDYLKLDSLVLAEQYLNEAHQIYRVKDDKRGLAISFNNLSELAIKKNQWSKAQSFLDSGQVLLQQVRLKELLTKHLELQVTLMEKTGRFAEALVYQKELSTLKEEIFQTEKLNVQKVESSYLVREKELERENATKEAALAKEEASRNAQLMVFLLAGLVIAVLVAILFVRLNQQLKDSNLIIQTQKLDLKHSTYNTLMRIQALLRITSGSMSDKHSKEKLMQAEAAIISAASLQQFTYGIENEGEVALGKFLEELVTRLKETFNISENPQISYQVEIIDDVILPMPIVLNCGLIVSEIVSNAIKYAFSPDSGNPYINVKLSKSGQNILLQVGDNGIGFSKDGKDKGIGTRMISRLARFIKAELSVLNENGTTYLLKLKTGNV